MGTRYADHVTPLYQQKLALTSPTGGGRSVGIVRSRTKATEFSFLVYGLGCRYCMPLPLGSTGFEKCYLATKSNYYYFYYYYIFVFYIWIRRCPKQLCNMHFTRSLAAECPFTLSTRHLNWKCGFDVTRSGLILIISYIRPQMQVHT